MGRGTRFANTVKAAVTGTIVVIGEIVNNTREKSCDGVYDVLASHCDATTVVVKVSSRFVLPTSLIRSRRRLRIACLLTPFTRSSCRLLRVP